MKILRKVCAVLLLAGIAAAATGVSAQNAKPANADSSKPPSVMPRTANGKPDFSGYWGKLTVDSQKLADSKTSIVDGFAEGNGSGEGFSWWLARFEQDHQITRRAQRNRPVYKPEYWQQIREKDWDFSQKNDPNNRCLPAVPRLGVPQKIVQTPNEIIFFYENINRFRIIPTDNRPHDPIRSEIPSWFGDSVGHWEGDTLVIETISLIDQSWLGETGYLHSGDLKVTEHYRREGNAIHLETTVEDTMLLQPWQMDPIAVQLNPNPKAMLYLEDVCEDRDSDLLFDPKNGDPTRLGH